MAFVLARIVVRSPTRLRLLFTDEVASAPLGAFFLGSLTPLSPDDPPVVEALIVQGSQVELVLGLAMFPGGSYQLHLTGGLVASTGAELAPAALLNIANPAPPVATSSQITIQELPRNVFGEDIVWDGADWLEGPDGDLQAISGPENARQALRRRMISNGLLWDDTYGLKPNEFVDAPAGTMPALAARAEVQALEDDRVKAADAKHIGANATNPGEQLIDIGLKFVDKSSTSVTVPVTAG